MAIELVVNDDSIDLTFTGFDRFLALSKGMHLPINEITDARVATVVEMRKSGPKNATCPTRPLPSERVRTPMIAG